MRAALAAGLALALATGSAAAEPRLVLMDPELDGDLSLAGQEAAWAARLDLVAGVVAERLAADGGFAVVDGEAVETERAKHRRRNEVYACVPCAKGVAAAAGADLVLSLRVFRMSQLVLSEQVIVRDGETGRIVYSRAADFRGDTDEAWLRATNVLVNHMIETDLPAALDRS